MSKYKGQHGGKRVKKFRQLVPLFLDAKNDILTRITEHDFGVKDYQKVSHNMILMLKYKGQHGGKKGRKIRAGVSHPPFRAMPERKHFFYRRCSLIVARCAAQCTPSCTAM